MRPVRACIQVWRRVVSGNQVQRGGDSGGSSSQRRRVARTDTRAKNNVTADAAADAANATKSKRRGRGGGSSSRSSRSGLAPGRFRSSSCSRHLRSAKHGKQRQLQSRSIHEHKHTVTRRHPQIGSGSHLRLPPQHSQTRRHTGMQQQRSTSATTRGHLPVSQSPPKAWHEYGGVLVGSFSQ
jgi:hypothetical protein